MEGVRNVFRRGCTIHLTKKPNLHLAWAAFEERNGKVFRIVNPLHAHTNVPNDFIYMYSFALKPESHQPTGSMNFSKIDNANLKITFKSALPAGKIRIYGLSYNILRIESGMGGLAFAN